MSTTKKSFDELVENVDPADDAGSQAARLLTEGELTMISGGDHHQSGQTHFTQTSGDHNQTGGSFTQSGGDYPQNSGQYMMNPSVISIDP